MAGVTLPDAGLKKDNRHRYHLESDEVQERARLTHDICASGEREDPCRVLAGEV